MTGIILLAAGGSSRLGQPKQLVVWQGKPLLRHAAETALLSEFGPVVVVLGAIDIPCRNCLEGLDLTIVRNPDWQEGMGGSIATGVRALSLRDLEGVIVMLCDQPFVSHELLRSLVAESAGHPIVNTFYQGQPGPPVWFSNAYFDRLAALKGKGGAKPLINAEPDRAQIVAEEAGIDIDSPEDLTALRI